MMSYQFLIASTLVVTAAGLSRPLDRNHHHGTPLRTEGGGPPQPGPPLAGAPTLSAEAVIRMEDYEVFPNLPGTSVVRHVMDRVVAQSGGTGSEPWFLAERPVNSTRRQWIVLNNDALWNPAMKLNQSMTSIKNALQEGWSHERQKGFVKITTHVYEKTTVMEVEIATPNTIVSVFLIMYTPVIMGWIAWVHYGKQEDHYLMLLPITLCATLIGDNFVNKSLAVLMDAPMAITSVQAFAMACIAAVILLAQLSGRGGSELINVATMWKPLAMWSVVAAMFTVYQLMNHLVALYCSLSERTVFTNLCPVVSLMLEITIMPVAMQASATFKSKLALGLMVIGAVIFSIQYPDFSTVGIMVASLMTIAVVPYRLAQRYMLTEARVMPVMLLVLYDGLFLMSPSFGISAYEQKNLFGAWEGWIEDSSIPILLFLSLLTFTGNHICALLLLRCNTATALQVYQNLSNFFVVGLGIMFFGDQVMSSPLVLVGIVICLFSGLWYAIESQPKTEPLKALSDKAATINEKALVKQLK